MSSTPEPAHLSNHHRNTLRQIFQHPVSHNIEWQAVVSLLEAVGSVVEHEALLTVPGLLCHLWRQPWMSAWRGCSWSWRIPWSPGLT
jgi:hypothetical protein